MNTYYFELKGVTPANLQAVIAALSAVPGCICTLIKTVMGGYLVSVSTDLTEDEALSAVNAALAHLNVVAVKTLNLTPQKNTHKGPK